MYKTESIYTVKHTKNKTGKLQDYKVPCDCIFNKVHKFSSDFYWKIKISRNAMGIKIGKCIDYFLKFYNKRHSI